MIDIDIINQIALDAGQAILEVYESDNFDVELKGNDSPLTRADRNADDVIVAGLKQHYPEIPVLSEEGREIPFEERKNWSKLWVVDPLDGTKEFIKRNGEFTVNIALVENNRAVAGVIYVPVKKVLYYAEKGKEAFKIENGEKTGITCNSFTTSDEGLNMVCSRSHLSPEVEAYLKNFKNPNTVSMGSSLKFMLVAEGKADIYPRLAPTMEWDTCAAQIILEEAGGTVIDQGTNETMVYNRKNLRNNHFIAFGKVIQE